MTTIDGERGSAARRVDALLVDGDIDPRPSTERVVVGPGTSAVFDGDRWQIPLYVSVNATGEQLRREFPRAALPACVETADVAVREHGVDLVWLRRRRRLRACLPRETVRWVERRLASAAHVAGATLVAQALPDEDGHPSPYEAVADRY